MSITLDGTNGITFPSSKVQSDAGIGYGQTWQNVLSSRALNVVYTNSTGRPIMVAAGIYGNGTQFDALYEVFVNESIIYVTGPSSGATSLGTPYSGGVIIVPNGATYRLSYGSYGYNLYSWWELR
jgi:hypothetical protein